MSLFELHPDPALLFVSQPSDLLVGCVAGVVAAAVVVVVEVAGRFGWGVRR